MDIFILLIAFLLGLLVGVIFWFWSKNQLQMQSVRLTAEAEHLKKHYTERVNDIQKLNGDLQALHQKNLQLLTEKTRITTEMEGFRKMMNEKAQETNQLQQQFRTDFENLANQILEKNTIKLASSQETSLTNLLNPLKERLQHFEKRVEESYGEEARERFHLKKELESLLKLNQQLGEEARNLTQALKGDSKMQGNWGEMILVKILENSGLRAGEEFIVQGKEMTLMNEMGERLQPDVIVQLPEKKHVIIDSKVSLTAYERYISENLAAEKEKHLKRHLDSLTTHIQQLSSKHYHQIQGLTAPDFVLLFMPLESAFSLAIQAKPDLFQFAFDKKIVVVSPTTLLATLKTVASIWKLEYQNQNAAEIARQGGLLYDKFVMFIEELEKVGKHIKSTQDTYDQVFKRLNIGRDSLISRAEKLRELGVKNNKSLKMRGEEEL
ncbi:MAG: DNA recombination protein RmuC [Bacteroidia bacterium]